MNGHLVIWFVGIATVSYVGMFLRSLRKSFTKQCCYKCFKFWFELSVFFLIELKLWLNQTDCCKAFCAIHGNFNISTMVANETSA